jgi:stress-induced-phosphoprotein 1
MIQQNPSLAGSAFNDPRMISVLGVLMGIDMQGFSGEDVPPEYASKADASGSSSTARATSSAFGSGSGSASTSTFERPPRAPTPPSAEDVKMEDAEEEDEDAIAEKKAKEEALAEKAKGNDAYKQRKFDVAIAAFEKAWDLWPKDVAFLTNLSGAPRHSLQITCVHPESY